MIKWIARKPTVETSVYLKFGILNMLHQSCRCPRCRHILNAGPEYQPKYCDQCGQHLTFGGIEWSEDTVLGFAERGDTCEQI